MERVLGIGGIFFRSEQPDVVARWYEQHPRDKTPPMESAPTAVTRTRGPGAQPAG